MLEILAKLLEKIIEFTINKHSAKKNKKGVYLLYEIYVNIFEIIRESNNLLSEINGFLRSPDYYWPRIFSSLRELSRELDNLAENYFKAEYTISIFDFEVHEQLKNIIGLKSQRIRAWAELLLQIAETRNKYPIIQSEDYDPIFPIHITDEIKLQEVIYHRVDEKIDWKEIEKYLRLNPIYIGKNESEILWKNT